MIGADSHSAGDVVAVIPARGGSKGILRKNVQEIGGIPLVSRAIRAVAGVMPLGSVFVSTDDSEIASLAGIEGARVVSRPAELASDTASSEVALVHACGEIVRQRGGVAPRVLVFVQATSPFIESNALEKAVRRVVAGECDVVFSAVETYEFLWTLTAEGAVGVNHDHQFRPRRQDREAHYRETGAFYVMDWEGFQNHKFRFFGRIGVEVTDPSLAIEIDDVKELDLARAIAELRGADDLPDVELSSINALVMDFDGVHTDDRVVVTQNGEESVIVSRSDGYGLALLRDANVRMLILSKETNQVVLARGRKLGIQVLQGVDDKASALIEWCARYNVDLARTAYVGNDLNDLPAMRLVGLPVAVPDAHPDVIKEANLVLTKPGGRGALREFAELMISLAQTAEGSKGSHEQDSADR